MWQWSIQENAVLTFGLKGGLQSTINLHFLSYLLRHLYCAPFITPPLFNHKHYPQWTAALSPNLSSTLNTVAYIYGPSFLLYTSSNTMLFTVESATGNLYNLDVGIPNYEAHTWNMYLWRILWDAFKYLVTEWYSYPRCGVRLLDFLLNLRWINQIGA